VTAIVASLAGFFANTRFVSVTKYSDCEMKMFSNSRRVFVTDRNMDRVRRVGSSCCDPERNALVWTLQSSKNYNDVECNFSNNELGHLQQ